MVNKAGLVQYLANTKFEEFTFDAMAFLWGLGDDTMQKRFLQVVDGFIKIGARGADFKMKFYRFVCFMIEQAKDNETKAKQNYKSYSEQKARADELFAEQ